MVACHGGGRLGIGLSMGWRTSGCSDGQNIHSQWQVLPLFAVVAQTFFTQLFQSWLCRLASDPELANFTPVPDISNFMEGWGSRSHRK